jgi:hypothetical protein
MKHPRILARAAALILIVAPASLVAQNVEPLPINSEGNDYAPTLTADGRTIYFCSDREGGVGDHDIWVAIRNGEKRGAFAPPMALPEPVNSEESEGVASIAADGRTIYFTACNRDENVGDCDIYVAEFVEGTFRNIRLVPNINSESWESNPTISADGSTLMFSSNRPGAMGGEGDIDIYQATLQSDGTWSPAENLGAPVNTARREDSPFQHAGGELLFFSSAGHETQGGLDFVVSRRTQGGGWGLPENIGTPFNSGRQDRFIAVPVGANDVYFCSDRTDLGGLGKLDLFVASSEAAVIMERNAPSKSVLAVLVGPNPASDRTTLTIIADPSATGARELVVTDNAGKEISRTTFSGERHELDLAGMPNGVYFARVDGRAARFVVRK